MAANWMRRSLMVAACASAALLAACGSSTTESAISPQRMIAFGDGMSDVGQKGTRYTVNDGSVNNWTLQVASGYGKTLTASSAGGKSYAAGNARIVAKPDAAGSNTTLTVKEQIDSFLASNTFTGDDLVMINGGISDVIANMAAVNAGTMTTEQMITASRQAGTDFAAQIRRLVNAGAKYVVVAGTYDLSKTPWATASKTSAAPARARVWSMRCRLAQVAVAGPYTVRRTGWGGSPTDTSTVRASKGSCIGPRALCKGMESDTGRASVGRLSMSHSERDRSTCSFSVARQYQPE